MNPGEFFVAEELTKERPDLTVCLPLKDVGFDFLVTKEDGSKAIRIQVKESRVYHQDRHSWHQLRSEKINDADVFVFVSYLPVDKEKRLAFETDFIVMPRPDVAESCKAKKVSKGKYSFYFVHDGKKAFEIRDKQCDVSKFRRAWDLI
jgi:hypothetical protein